MPELDYLEGFANYHVAEAMPGALPEGQNSPQRCPYGLYAEQISGTAFTAPRAANRRSWLYRIRPSVVQGKFRPLAAETFLGPPFTPSPAGPNPQRWDPLPDPSPGVDFVDGLFTVCGSAPVDQQCGIAVHLFAMNRDMGDRFFYDADGELLFVPQSAQIRLDTELGHLAVSPGEVALVPRGMKFQAAPGKPGELARGYVCENFGRPFELPELGPIGANGLANPRDFLAPAAAFEDRTGRFELIARYCGQLWVAQIGHSPLDVVAWHGNHVPYKYDLARFQVINTVSFDHCDPSIFTVLTSPSDRPGTANCDFVIFPPRWMVAEHTFRPPWFHRNIMSEYMGLVRGAYDAKASGFVPGGSSLHNCMTPHGPDLESFERASEEDLGPRKLTDTLAFMFESCRPLHPTEQAMAASFRQADYGAVWSGLESRFQPDSGR